MDIEVTVVAVVKENCIASLTSLLLLLFVPADAKLRMQASITAAFVVAMATVVWAHGFPPSFGPRRFGPRRFGPRPFGPRPFGGRPFGSRPFFGPHPFLSYRPFGPRPFGPKPFGPRPYGPRPFRELLCFAV